VTLRGAKARFVRYPWGMRLLMLLAGGLPLLAFPALNLEFLAWFALVPGLVLIINSPRQREAGVRAWWLGAGYLITALYWMAPEIGPGLLLVGGVFGVLWVPFGVAAWRLLRPPVTWPRALAALVVLPSCWLLTEWLRSWQALGGPWAVYGASQWQHPAVLALAAVGGVWLISFVLVMTNVAIVLMIGSRRLSLLAAGVAVLAVGIGAGPLAFALTPAAPAVRQVTIAMVQPGLIHNPTARADASEALTAALSGSGALGRTRPDLIVWGESSVAFDLTVDHSLLSRIEALSKEDGAEILVNQDSTIPAKGQEKVAVLVSPAGVLGTYVKTRLVPFGEYIPFRQQLGWLTKISNAAAANMVPGTGAHLLHATDRSGRPLPIGVLICFESAFPDMSRVETDQGAQLIVYQSSTSTFQGTWGPDQHASLGALRAAETGRPVVQAALTGDTVAFDARGRQLAWMGQSEHGVVTVHLGLPAVSVRTPYDRLGDYVPWAATAIVVISALILLARSRGFLGGDTSVRDGRAAEYDASTGQRVAS
jgi:apolipoprotein N-acyltransferase